MGRDVEARAGGAVRHPALVHPRRPRGPASPAEIATESAVNRYPPTRTSAATGPVAAGAALATGAGFGLPWSHGANRFKCSGIVNSNPYSILLKPTEFPWIVLVVALLAWRENGCGEPGMTRSSPTLQAARTSGLTNEPTSALTAM